MKHVFLYLAAFFSTLFAAGQSVGINETGAAPFAGAILDIQSTSKGLLIPRMNTTQRLGITNVTQGLMIYDTDLNQFMFYNSGWKTMGNQGWNLTGNTALTASQFLGSIDATAVRFRSNNQERMRIEANGNLQLLSDQQSILFANATATTNAPMMYMFPSGTQNRDRMLLALSPAFPKAGIEIRDSSDAIFFRDISARRFAFELGTGNMGIGVEDPSFRLDLAGSMRIKSVGSAPNSAGIWFANQFNTFDRVFLGMSKADSGFGIYSQNLGRWAIEFEVMREPRIGINTRNGGDGVVRAEVHIMHTNFGGSNDGIRIQNEGSNNHYWNLYTSNTTGGFEFFKNGIKRAIIDQTSGAYTSVSDRKTKRNITPMQDGLLQRIMQLKPKYYQYAAFSDDEGNTIASDRFHYGFIAQEVEPLFPELIFRGSDNPAQDFLTMNYSGFGVLAIKAIQEQQAIIEQQQVNANNQQAEIRVLKKQLELLSNRLDQLAPTTAASK